MRHRTTRTSPPRERQEIVASECSFAKAFIYQGFIYQRRHKKRTMVQCGFAGAR
jgi:hypothetical protein